MYIIEHFSIQGIWGGKEIQTKLNKEVNIFIGKNGTGKTTVINILNAALLVDLSQLASSDFTSLKLVCSDDKRRLNISVIKTEEDQYYGSVKYKIGRNVYEMPLIPKDVEYRRMHSKTLESIERVRQKMKELFSVCWLSVHREIIEQEEARDRYAPQKNPRFGNPIDRRLSELMAKLTSYQLQLQSQYGKLSADFQKKVLISMLYRSEFDSYAGMPESDYNLGELKEKLTQAYQALGVKDVNLRIDEHISKLENTIAQLTAYHKEQKPIAVDDVMPIALYKRTKHIVNLSNELDQGKKRLFEPINRFFETIKLFAKDSSLKLDINKDGSVCIIKNKKPIEPQYLSSGEKQLLILLAETLLQKNQTFIFIADEPELSLHIEWQRELLCAIKKLNANAQIIVATHSPEIAGRWRNNVIKMEGIING